MSKIIGITVGSQLPKPNLNQTDPTKGDYIKGSRSFINDVTNLKDLVGDTSVAEQIGDALENSKADWEVNDETSAAYIKNRTHYKGTQIVLPETTTVTDPNIGGDQYITVPFTSPITPGKSYIVNLNGTTYNTSSKKVEYEG